MTADAHAGGDALNAPIGAHISPLVTATLPLAVAAPAAFGLAWVLTNTTG
jgi:hypothetical protein